MNLQLLRGDWRRGAACFLLSSWLSASGASEERIEIEKWADSLGFMKPIPVWITGFSGEVDSVLKQDLLFMGVESVPEERARFQIIGKNEGRVEARVIEKVTKNQVLGKAFAGGTTRSQTHALADEIARVLTGKPGIAQTQIVFKSGTGNQNSEIFVAEYDGHNPKQLTRDNTVVADPAWLGRDMLLYTSYKLGNPDIFSHNLENGQRKPVARFSGLNSGAAVSPDGQQVAMILSKGGSPDVYLANLDGSNLRRLTTTREEESSPTWSPDGRSLCYASRQTGVNALYVASASGGPGRRLETTGVSNCTEPDWSPDGRFIVFTSQARDFRICVVPAGGGEATIITTGEDPSWAPNSRAVVFTRRKNYKRSLSLLDVPTKQVKDLAIVLESSSQPSWAR